MTKILVLNSDMDGVGYYRILSPHLNMNDDNFQIDIRLLSDSTLPILNKNWLSQYKILVFNKRIPFVEKEKENLFYNNLKELGIKIVFDIDDYWRLNSSHINYKSWTKNKQGELVEEMLRLADVVTTTTEIFAEKIKEINPNVVVLPNAVNHNEQQWFSNKTESEKLRFIWGGGITHYPDLQLLQNDFRKFDKHFLANNQMIMCGYDLRIKMKDGSIKSDDKNSSMWGKFENIFTNRGKYIKNAKYKNYLNNSNNFDNDENYGRTEEFINEFYQRRHTKPIGIYGSMYNEADIALAPLKGNKEFNKMKSQLKLIEAGAHKMPIIMSKTGPYLLDDIEKNGLGLYVEEGKDSWYDKMKWYSENPNAVIDHGLANHEYYLKNFDINQVNKKRIELYNSLLK